MEQNSRMKKLFYIVCTMLLCTLLSFLVHLVVLINLFPYANPSCTAQMPLLMVLCLLPAWTIYSTGATGIVAGYFCGQTWWRIIYIERRRFRLGKQ